MTGIFTPWDFLLIALAGWINQRQLHVIEYLKQENRVLKQQLGKKQLRLSDDRRRRLAVKGQVLGRKALAEVASIVMPDTIRRWFRKLVAAKWDRSARRGPGRPPVMALLRLSRYPFLALFLRDYLFSASPIDGDVILPL